MTDYVGEVKLKEISEQVSKLQNEYLKQTGGKTTIVDKCRNFSQKSWKIVNEMRELAANKANSEVIEGRRDELLEWPSKRCSDPTLFYDGTADKITFNRNKDWFKTMGLKQYDTPYTFTDRWDKKEIKATFLVPDNIGPNDKPGVMWFMHGGGFCTGASDHIPWYGRTSAQHAYRTKSIIISPDYPLMPESASTDITSSLRDFLLFYANDLFFRTQAQPFDNWTSWLSHVAKIPRINPRQAPIFIEGESAGGHAAVMTVFINAEKGGIGLPVKVALLRFPMLAHYTRTFEPNMKYMSHEVSKEEAETQVRKLEEEIAKLENYGLVPTRVKGYAPDKMAGAFLLSTMGRWKSVFQRSHGPYAHDIVKAGQIEWPVNGDVEQTWDCIERAEGSVGKVDHTRLPPMVIYHGDKDGNCPIEDTERFVGVLKAKYPGRYNDNTVYLEKVTYLSGKEKPVGSQTPVTAVNHAFDYQILEEHEPWLKDIYDKVDAHWTA